MVSNRKRGGNNKTDYILSLDMAKELAMVENNEKGREARRYFIQMEKKATGMIQHQPAVSQVPAATNNIESSMYTYLEIAFKRGFDIVSRKIDALQAAPLKIEETASIIDYIDTDLILKIIP